MNETHLIIECSELEDIRLENGISWLLLEVSDQPLREQSPLPTPAPSPLLVIQLYF